MTDLEILGIAYDCNVMPEACTDAGLIKFAKTMMNIGRQEVRESLHNTTPLTDAHIKDILVGNGFKTYPDFNNDLKPYCYAAIRAVEKEVLRLSSVGGST